MDTLIEKLEEWMRDLFSGCVSSNLEDMFLSVNEKAGGIAAEVGKSPAAWNRGIFDMIRNLSDSVIVPIAGIIISFVLCYELLSMIMERNNLHDMDTWMIFKWIIKSVIAIYLVSHTFDIVMGIFDVGQHLVSAAGGVIGSNTAIDISSTITTIEEGMEDMTVGTLILLTIETLIVSVGLKIIALLISVILVVRMIEIYLYVSISPVPFATMVNREWGQVGNNYLRGLLALGFQGFFIMVVVGIYCVLINNMTVSADIHSALWSIAGYTVVLCLALFKTGSLSKAIFNAR